MGSDLAKADAHEITPEEYAEIPELTKEWFAQAELRVGGVKVARAKRERGRSTMNTVPAVQMGSLVPANMSEAMKLADLMANCSLVPRDLQKKPADCLMVIMQAIRWQMDPFAVAQECSIIQGKLMHQGKLVAAVVNARGNLVQRLQYTYTGEGDDRTITVIGKLHGEARPREVSVILRNAKTNNAQWQKQPDQQLAYHGTRVWARRHTPELMLGVNSPEEFDEALAQPPAEPPHDSETGELADDNVIWEDEPPEEAPEPGSEEPRADPHSIPLGDAGWPAWADKLLGHINRAESLRLINDWLIANNKAIGAMEKADRGTHSGLKLAVELRRRALQGGGGEKR